MSKIIIQREKTSLGGEIDVNCMFSSKPQAGYLNYYEKMTAYVRMLEGYAHGLDPSATARTFPPLVTDENVSVFRYPDSATSRARIGAAVEKLSSDKVVIVGLGGTGPYILDQVAKTPVREIHLYDPDTLYTHNVFRAPGAASPEELSAAPKKVEYFRDKYDAMHRHIVTH